MILDDPEDLDDVDEDLVDEDPADNDVDLLDLASLGPPRPDLMSTGPSPRLAHLVADGASPGLRRLVAGELAESSRYAYERDWADFALWCRIHAAGVDPLDAGPLLVGEYLTELVADRKAFSTLRRRLAAITYWIELTGRDSPARDPLIVKAMRGAQRALSAPANQAAPIRIDDLRRIVTALPILEATRPGMRRDQTLIALGWAGALRSSELVSLDVDDLHWVGDPDRGDGGLVLSVRDAKRSAGVEYVAIPFATQMAWCPARRVLAYTRRLRSGPLFRSVDRHGKPGSRLRAASVTGIVRQAVTSCLGVDAAPYRSHSLRAGFVTEARAHGVADTLIARHTRHSRPGDRRGGMLDVYDRPADLLERPALGNGWW